MFFVILALIALVSIYLYSTRTFNYWKERGIKHDKPVPLFGTNAAGYLLRNSTAGIAGDVYWRYPKERVVGFFRSTTPELVIRDPDLVKRVLITDFLYFYKRNVIPESDNPEPLSRSLFNADGDIWRLLRQRLTPVFTSGKLKAMFPLIVERAERLESYLESAAETGRTVDSREIMARFTTKVIGACAFGLDANCLNEQDLEFRKLGNKIFAPSLKTALKLLLKVTFPQLFSHFKLTSDFEGDVMNMVNGILAQRNHRPSGRHDFIDQLLECKEKGIMEGDSMEHFNPDGSPARASQELTVELIAAQVFVFFIAGFETSSSSTSSTMHLLAYYPEIQTKVQNHIDQVLAKYDNKLCYDAIKEMTYLEWTFKESMRIYPPVGFIIRECTKKYTFEDLGLTIDKGVKIIIPTKAMQNDPKYFDNPEEFCPERFDPNVLDADKTKYVYLPFGEGPRYCIGSRLGLMQSMAGLAAILSKFSVEPAPTTVRHPVVEGKPTAVEAIKNGLPLIFKKRKAL